MCPWQMKNNGCFSLWLSQCDISWDAPRPPLCREAMGNTVWPGNRAHLGEQEDEGIQLSKGFLAAAVDTEINVNSDQNKKFHFRLENQREKLWFWNAKKCFILIQKFQNAWITIVQNFCSFHSRILLFCVIFVGNKSRVISISCSMEIPCLCSSSYVVKWV